MSESKQSQSQIRTCPACGVKLEGEVVHFSYGPQGTISRLYARVCSHAKAAGKGKGCLIEEVPDYTGADGYQPLN